MRDIIYIGATPCDEECAQVGSPDYHTRMLRESKAFIKQLRRILGNEPDGARLFVKAQSHDFGTYHEVVCEYDDAKPASLDYAIKCEAQCPATWDAEAKKELDYEPW